MTHDPSAPAGAGHPAAAGRITAYTDGGCSGNPGPGAWAYIILAGERRLQEAGAESYTTNNRMELSAVIAALKRALSEPAGREPAIDIYTDSRYVQKGISEWILKWERNGWKSSTRSPIKNQDLWKELRALTLGRDVRWHWLEGHAGHPLNEACDRMVQQEIRRLKRG